MKFTNWKIDRLENILPKEFFNLVEKLSPGPMLEMYARAPRPGWSVWGLEADGDVMRLPLTSR